MQRWILIGAVALVLLLGGAAYGLYSYKQTRPDKVWVPLPLRTDLPVDKQTAIVKELNTRLQDHQALVKVSRDTGLTTKWQLASDDDGARQIKERLFVDLGTTEISGAQVPAVLVGARGIRKEHDVLGEISMRLMKDVWTILGLEQPSKPAASN